MKIKKQKDLWTGAMFVAFGSLFTVYSMQYRAGTAAKMGAGYFPRLLSAILILTGLVLIFGSLLTKTYGEKVHKFNWRTIALVIGPVFLFGLLLHPLGMILSLFILIVGTSFASHEFEWKGTLVNSVVLILICLVIFVWSLKLQFQVWPFFLGR
jgi:hypothetical protein